VLCKRYELGAPGLRSIAKLVHDNDMRRPRIAAARGDAHVFLETGLRRIAMRDTVINSVSFPSHPMILFVCEHGVGRSALAAAYFDRLARRRGLEHRAQFRYSGDLDPVLPPTVLAGLAEDGFDTRLMTPAAITAADLGTAERVIVMGCSLPARQLFADKFVDWQDIPAPTANYGAARDDISARVESLIASLAGD
jgi:protein-tyrosine-phosphatase